MSVGIGFHIDHKEVDKGFDEMTRRARRPRSAFVSLRKAMRNDQRDHARLQEGPDGHWPARKQLTGGAKKARRRNRRKLLGRLPGALIVRAESDRIVAVSKVAWSLIHQEGGRAGKGAIVPKREFLWISDGLLNTVADHVADHVAGGF